MDGRDGTGRRHQGGKAQAGREVDQGDQAASDRSRHHGATHARTSAGPPTELTTLQRSTAAHKRAVYGLDQFNFDPYDYKCHTGAVPRSKYLDANHEDKPLKKTYASKEANHLLCMTARHALGVLKLNMPLRVAMHAWDMEVVLKAVIGAAKISAKDPWRTVTEAAAAVEHALRDHRLDEHRLRLTAQEDRGMRSADAIWLLPPAWPTAEECTWLGDAGLAAILALARTDLANRMKEPAESTNGTGRPVV